MESVEKKGCVISKEKIDEIKRWMVVFLDILSIYMMFCFKNERFLIHHKLYYLIYRIIYLGRAADSITEMILAVNNKQEGMMSGFLIMTFTIVVPIATSYIVEYSIRYHIFIFYMYFLSCGNVQKSFIKFYLILHPLFY